MSMLPLLSVFRILFLLSYGVHVRAQCGDGNAQTCSRAFKCSDSEDAVWATDGRHCTVYRNGCHLALENCKRQNNCYSALQAIEQEECQYMCPVACTRQHRPICAEHNGNRRTFGNKCEMQSHMCLTGDTYSMIKKGNCMAELSSEVGQEV